MEQQWYVMVGENDQRGPLSEAEVNELIESRQASAADYCWTEGFEGWAPLQQVPTFAEALRKATSAAQPPPGPTSAGQTWSTIKSSLDRGKRGAARKVKIAKLKMRISQLRKNRDRLCTALGTELYRRREEIELDEDLQDYIKSIDQCDDEIAGVEREIAEIEAETE